MLPFYYNGFCYNRQSELRESIRYRFYSFFTSWSQTQHIQMNMKKLSFALNSNLHNGVQSPAGRQEINMLQAQSKTWLLLHGIEYTSLITG